MRLHLSLIIALYTSLFWAVSASIAHAQLRPMVYTDKIVDAPQAQVWEDWTSTQGLESFFAPKAIVERKPGGAYEVWFSPDAPKGQRGAEDGVILGLQDGKMIQFTWAMPPYMPEIRSHMSVVQMWFVPEDDNKTRIRLFHTGFGDTPAWKKGRDYFATTWPAVLNQYADHVQGKTTP